MEEEEEDRAVGEEEEDIAVGVVVLCSAVGLLVHQVLSVHKRLGCVCLRVSLCTSVCDWCGV